MQTRLEPRAQPNFDDPAHAAIALAGVTKAYPRQRGGEITAVAGLSLTVAEREVVAVVGPSGCGKSTLLELVCRLIAPDSGVVDAQPAALMPQHDLLLPWLSALDNAALALRAGASRGARPSRRESRARAGHLLADFGLGEFERARPHELSGGMRQRVAFVRALLAGKPVLCLDEPFGALDAITRQEMQGWLAGAFTREPRTLLLVTHDVEEAVMLADRVAVMSPRPGRIVAELEVDQHRPRERTDPAVVSLRERAMRALR